MGAADLLAYVRRAGFTRGLADDKLLVKPASRLTDELRTARWASKPEVLALLAVEHADCRTLCLECQDMTGTLATGWRGSNHKAAAVGRELPGDLVTLFQTCVGSSGVPL
jgi:hypothetical protein